MNVLAILLITSTPARAFNLGTAQIAAGNREVGSSTIAKAMADPSLRADAFFNRGNSALAANAFDYAIRDFSQTLRLRPSDASAKRNLEIALRRKEAMQKQQQGGGNGAQQNHGPQPQQKPQPSPQQGGQQQQKSDPNVEGLLRSVQQQEQEELQRMHKPSRERLHVGW
jgi:Ca-activated chloride channel family protein